MQSSLYLLAQHLSIFHIILIPSPFPFIPLLPFFYFFLLQAMVFFLISYTILNYNNSSLYYDTFIHFSPLLSLSLSTNLFRPSYNSTYFTLLNFYTILISSNYPSLAGSYLLIEKLVSSYVISGHLYHYLRFPIHLWFFSLMLHLRSATISQLLSLKVPLY